MILPRSVRGGVPKAAASAVLTDDIAMVAPMMGAMQMERDWLTGFLRGLESIVKSDRQLQSKMGAYLAEWGNAYGERADP